MTLISIPTQTIDPGTHAHLFGVSVLHVDAMWVNHTANRYSGGLLEWDMGTKMTPNETARSPKTHSNLTIHRVLPRCNRAFLSDQQTTASIAARMCAAAIFHAGLTQTNSGHAAFYRIRRPVLRDAVAPPVRAGCDLIGACAHQVSSQYCPPSRLVSAQRKSRFLE
jgi:hypothetical protein